MNAQIVREQIKRAKNNQEKLHKRPFDKRSQSRKIAMLAAEYGADTLFFIRQGDSFELASSKALNKTIARKLAWRR